VTASSALDPESEARADSLRRALSRSDGFGLYLVLADGDARGLLLKRLRVWIDEKVVPVMEMLPMGADGVARVYAALGGGERPHNGWVLQDGDALFDAEGADTLAALNITRDRLGEIIPGPLVIVAAPRHAVDFMDLYEVRRGTWQLRSVAPQRMWELAHERVGEIDDAFLKEWQERLDEDEREGRGQPSAWVDARLWIAASQADKGAFEEALANIERARGLASETGYISGRVRADVRDAEIATRRGDRERARGVLTTARHLAREAGDVQSEAMALFHIVQMSVVAGREAILLEHVRDLVALSQSVDVVPRAAVGRLRARIEARRGQSSSAATVLRDEVIPLLEATDSFAMLGGAWTDLANIERSRGNLLEAETILREQVLPLLERDNDPQELVQAALVLADVLRGQERSDEALRLLREVALPKTRATSDERGQAIVLGRIADVLGARGEHFEALRIRLDEEVPAYRRLGDRRERSMALAKAANSMSILGRHQEAFDLLMDDVIPEREHLGDAVLLANGWLEVAEVLLLGGFSERALGVIEHEAFPTLRVRQEREPLARALLLKANALANTGNVEKARRILEGELIPELVAMGNTALLGTAREGLRTLSTQPKPRPHGNRAQRRRKR
jgi:tetratricopeptide (TPR) repeat protein